jgi:hypothetical protein
VSVEGWTRSKKHECRDNAYQRVPKKKSFRVPNSFPLVPFHPHTGFRCTGNTTTSPDSADFHTCTCRSNRLFQYGPRWLCDRWGHWWQPPFMSLPPPCARQHEEASCCADQPYPISLSRRSTPLLETVVDVLVVGIKGARLYINLKWSSSSIEADFWKI